MKIACVQFNPQVGDVNNNMIRAERVLTKGMPKDEELDLLVLPEMALSGYNFESLNHIFSSLEPTASGISSLWARTKALTHGCHVLIGYPEKVDVSKQWPTDPQYYNSAIMFAPSGDTAAHHRKAFLYYTDERWALEGDNGFYGDHIQGLGQTALGICMDINPYKFDAPWEDYEFATHILQCDANLVIFSMAWVTPDPADQFTSAPNEPDLATLAYWAMRLEPLIRAKSRQEIIIVFGNRCGSEGDAVYTGTSAVLGIQDGVVNVYGVLGRCESKLLVVDTNRPPTKRLAMMGSEIRLVETSAGARESRSQTTPPRSSAKPDEGEKGEREGSRTRSREQTSTPLHSSAKPDEGEKGERERSHTRSSRKQSSTSLRSSAKPDKGERGEREGSRTRSRERNSTPSRRNEARPTKEAVPTSVLYDPPRQPLHHLAPTPPTQRGSPSLTPSLTPDTSKKARTHPHKLTIPETSSHSWRKASETMTGSPVGAGRALDRKRLKGMCEPQATQPAANAPDSAVVLSAVERPRGSMLSPADSAIGRATPDTRPWKSSRWSGENRLSRPKEVAKLDTILAEEIAAEEEADLRAQTLKDSPVAKKPDSSVLAHWLETLPPVKGLEAGSNTPPTGPGVQSARREVVSNTPPIAPRVPSVGRGAVSNTPPTAPGVPSAGREAAPRDRPVCHTCGQDIPKGEKTDVGRKGEKRRASKVAAEAQGLKEAKVERESKDNGVSPQPETLQNGLAHSGPQCLDVGDHAGIQGGALLRVEEKEDGVLQLQVFGTNELTPERTQEQGGENGVLSMSKALDGVARVGDKNEASHATADNAVQASQASPAEVKSTNNKSVEKSEPRIDGAGAAGSRMEKAEQEIQKALAPRARLVPPPIKGMEKVVTVGIRPSSVAW